MATPINPMPEYVVVEQEKSAHKTASGLYLPDSAKEKPKTAKVVAIGENVYRVKIGDRVIYKDDFNAGNVTVPVEKEEFVVVHQQNIIASVGPAKFRGEK